VVIATSLCADHTEDEASPSRCSLPSDKVVCPRLYGIGGDGRGSRPLRRRSRALDRVLKSIRGRIDGQYWAQSLLSAMHKPVTTSRLCSIAVCPHTVYRCRKERHLSWLGFHIICHTHPPLVTCLVSFLLKDKSLWR